MSGVKKSSAKELLAARTFLAAWFGFDRRKIHICGLRHGPDGTPEVIQFRVYGYRPMGWIAYRRKEQSRKDWDAERNLCHGNKTARASEAQAVRSAEDWELIPLP